MFWFTNHCSKIHIFNSCIFLLISMDALFNLYWFSHLLAHCFFFSFLLSGFLHISRTGQKWGDESSQHCLNKNETLEKHLLKSMTSVPLLGEAPFSCEFYLLIHLPSSWKGFQESPKIEKKQAVEINWARIPWVKSPGRKMMGKICSALIYLFT